MWVGIPVCLIALICSAVGLGIPFWAEYEHEASGLKMHYGIIQVCFDLFGCQYTATTGTMNAVRALQSLGTLLLLMSLIFAIVRQCWAKAWQLKFVAGVLAFIAGVCIFIGVGIFGSKKETQYSDRQGDSRATSYFFHAGFYISIAAGVLSLVAGVLFLVDTAIENNRKDSNVPQPGLPVVEIRHPAQIRYSSRLEKDPSVITTHTYSRTGSHNSQPLNYYLEEYPYYMYQKKHSRQEDFAL